MSAIVNDAFIKSLCHSEHVKDIVDYIEHTYY